MHSSALLNFVRVQFPGCILIISSRVSYHISIEPKNETSIYSQNKQQQTHPTDGENHYGDDPNENG